MPFAIGVQCPAVAILPPAVTARLQEIGQRGVADGVLAILPILVEPTRVRAEGRS
jgi:hypothetical protein